MKYISEMLMTNDDHDVLQRYAVCEVAMLQAACSGHMALQRCSGLRSDWRRNVFYREIRNLIFSKYWRVRGTGRANMVTALVSRSSVADITDLVICYPRYHLNILT